MKKQNTGRIIVMVFLASMFFSAISAQNSLLYEVSLEKQIELSNKVIEGKVIAKKCVWNNTRTLIYTVNLVEVYKSFKGSSPDYIDVITLGGKVGNYSLEVCPELKFTKGDVGIFMLKESIADISSNTTTVNKQFEVVSETQGFYNYILKDDKAINPFSAYDGISQNLHQKIQSISSEEIIENKDFYVKQSLDYSVSNNAGSASISSISPNTASAGTKTVLTITGSGFGSSMGTVSFKNADDGGATYVDALSSEMKSWSEDVIEVYIPYQAGTGTIRITNASSGIQESDEELKITFAQSNNIRDGNALLTNLVDINTQGGYTWHMFTDFYANTKAKESFTRAFNTWKCYSNVNWKLGETTSNDVTALDGENVIRFDNGDELPEGSLGRCLSYEYTCDENVAILEMDMIVDDTENWNFGPEAPDIDEFDLESVIVHELGHGHQLGHVLDSDDVMFWGERSGDMKRDLSANDKAGADYVFARSIQAGVCDFGAMTKGACTVSSIVNQSFADYFKIYPNPASSVLYIENSRHIKLKGVSVFDITGRKLFAEITENYGAIQSIDISSLSRGVYILNIISENTSATKQFFVE